MSEPSIGWSDLDRQRARNHPEEYPEELTMGLKAALEAVRRRKNDNYDNPAWEPVIGFLQAEAYRVELRASTGEGAKSE